MNFSIESSRTNPYAPPRTVCNESITDHTVRRAPWMRRLLLLQTGVIVVSLCIEAYEHESIVGSGPIFALVGLAIAFSASRHRDPIAMVFGLSAVVFAAVVVFLINFNSWGPAQGDGPITLMSFAYAAIAVPLSFWLAFGSTKESR